MTSAEIMAELKGWRLAYILGVREHTDKRELALDDARPFVSLVETKTRQ